MMAEPNEVIGVSPAQLLFGNSIQLDRGIFLFNLPKEGVEAEIALSDWADKMFEAQRVLLDTAQRLQQQTVLDIWKRPQVLLHALTLAPMS